MVRELRRTPTFIHLSSTLRGNFSTASTTSLPSYSLCQALARHMRRRRTNEPGRYSQRNNRYSKQLWIRWKAWKCESTSEKNLNDGANDKSKSKKKQKQQKKKKRVTWIRKRSGNSAIQKVVEGKRYYWYPYHNDGKSKWVHQTLSECRNNPNNSDGKVTQHTANAVTTKHQFAQQFTTAAQAAAAVAALTSSNGWAGAITGRVKVIGLRIISLICHVLHPTALFLLYANPITECYFIALASAILYSVGSYWIITWMSEHSIFVYRLCTID